MEPTEIIMRPNHMAMIIMNSILFFIVVGVIVVAQGTSLF